MCQRDASSRNLGMKTSSSFTLSYGLIRIDPGHREAVIRWSSLLYSMIRLRTANGVVVGIDVSAGGSYRLLPINANCATILALGTIESTRLALYSFPRKSQFFPR